MGPKSGWSDRLVNWSIEDSAGGRTNRCLHQSNRMTVGLTGGRTNPTECLDLWFLVLKVQPTGIEPAINCGSGKQVRHRQK